MRTLAQPPPPPYSATILLRYLIFFAPSQSEWSVARWRFCWRWPAQWRRRHPTSRATPAMKKARIANLKMIGKPAGVRRLSRPASSLARLNSVFSLAEGADIWPHRNQTRTAAAAHPARTHATTHQLHREAAARPGRCPTAALLGWRMAAADQVRRTTTTLELKGSVWAQFCRRRMSSLDLRLG